MSSIFMPSGFLGIVDFHLAMAPHPVHSAILSLLPPPGQLVGALCLTISNLYFRQDYSIARMGWELFPTASYIPFILSLLPCLAVLLSAGIVDFHLATASLATRKPKSLNRYVGT
jgi:hypothetical protein